MPGDVDVNDFALFSHDAQSASSSSSSNGGGDVIPEPGTLTLFSDWRPCSSDRSPTAVGARPPDSRHAFPWCKAPVRRGFVFVPATPHLPTLAADRPLDVFVRHPRVSL